MGGCEKAAGKTPREGLRTSHAERDQVIEVLKAAFVHGYLAKDEFDERVGQVLASQTYAALTVVTADLPTRVAAALPPPPRSRARARKPAAHARAGVWGACAGILAALAAAFFLTGHAAGFNQNPARWTLYVPPGWHVLRFSVSNDGVHSAGIQLSNVRLPGPTLLPGTATATEVSGEVLPPGGVGLVITTNANHSLAQEKAAVPPLPLPWPDASHSDGWLLGSSLAPAPVFEWLRFRVNGTMYVAAITIGWKASRAAEKALVPIVRSIEPGPASS